MDETNVTKEKPEETAFKEPFSYRKLFISTFLISAFTVGGGFVLIPLMKAKFVDEYGWLKENEALDLVSIAQSAPGVMACNSSIIMGYRMGGFLGSLTALLATVRSRWQRLSQTPRSRRWDPCRTSSSQAP